MHDFSRSCPHVHAARGRQLVCEVCIRSPQSRLRQVASEVCQARREGGGGLRSRLRVSIQLALDLGARPAGGCDRPLRARQAWDQGLAEALSPLARNLPPLDSVVPAGDAANAGAIAMALPPRQKFGCAAPRCARARAPRASALPGVLCTARLCSGAA